MIGAPSGVMEDTLGAPCGESREIYEHHADLTENDG